MRLAAPFPDHRVLRVGRATALRARKEGRPPRAGRQKGESMRRSYRNLLAVSGLFFAAAAPAFAQAADDDEIIVTAQKRAESVQSIPASITAVGAEALEERGIAQVQDLQFLVPSFQAGKLLGATAIAIRGVGLNQGAPGVAVHVDGVYQPRPAMGDLAQVDLERVEVLRGPQGTLYGRNANGGAVNFITRAPTDEFGGEVSGSFATFEELRLRSILNMPVSDRVSTRLVLDYWNREEGFVENVTPTGPDLDKGETISGRFRLRAELTDALTFDLSLQGLHQSGPLSYFTLYNAPTATAIGLNPYLAGAIVPLQPHLTAANDRSDSSRSFSAVTGTFTWDLGNVELKSITGWTRFMDDFHTDSDATQLSAFPQYNHNVAETLTQELNLTGTAGPLDWVAGLYYMDDQSTQYLFYDFQLGIFPLPAGSYLEFNTPKYDTVAYAAFVDGTLNVSERFRLLAGVRYSRDEQSVTQQNEAGALIGGVQFPFLITCPLQTNDLTFESVTPRAGLQYELAEQQNVYFTYSRGFKSGGINFSACNNRFQPEEITSFEAGYRSRLFGNALTLNASLFHYKYDDLQLSQVVGLTSLVRNAAGAEVNGLEVETVWSPDEHWTINANLSLLDATYTEFVNIDSLAPLLGPQDVAGNNLNNAPESSLNLGLNYRWTETAFGQWSARLDASYRDTTYFREFNNPLDSQAAYTILNANLIWNSPQDAYAVRIFGTNLTDEEYIARMGSSDNFGSRYVSWGAPRQMGVEVRARF